MANTKKIIKNIVLKNQQRDFPGGPEVKILLFQCRGPKVSSLVWALRFCMLQIAAKKPHKNREIKVVCVCACMLIHFNRVRLCATSWSVACQVPLPMEDENVHVILQARILEWVATSSWRGFSQHKDQTCFSFVNIYVNYVNNYIKYEFESKRPKSKGQCFQTVLQKFCMTKKFLNQDSTSYCLNLRFKDTNRWKKMDIKRYTCKHPATKQLRQLY